MFFEFKQYCPHTTEVAWKKLLEVTDNRSAKKFEFQDLLDVARVKNEEYTGYLKPYEFMITPLSRKMFFGLSKKLPWRIYGAMEPYMNGCNVKGFIRPEVSYIVFMAVLVMVFIVALHKYFYEPQPGAEIGLIAVVAVFMVMIGIWMRACTKHKNALCELFGGKALSESGGGTLQSK